MGSGSRTGWMAMVSCLALMARSTLVSTGMIRSMAKAHSNGVRNCIESRKLMAVNTWAHGRMGSNMGWAHILTNRA